MKKSLIKFSLASVAVMALLTGCGPSSGSVEPEAYTNPELQGAPKWVLIPEVEGVIAALGVAQTNAGNDIGYQREEAMGNGRDNLARSLGIKVSNMLKSYKAATGSGEDKTFDKSSESVSKQIASKTLNGSKLKDMWISRSGTMYALMVLDTKNVANMLEESIKTTYKNDKAMYQKFLHSKAQGDLDKELEKNVELEKTVE